VGNHGGRARGREHINNVVVASRRPRRCNQQHARERRLLARDYLPGFSLPESLRATSDLREAVSAADVLVMAVPSHGFRAVAAEAAPYLRPWVPVVSLVKGVERDSLKRMSEVTAEEMPGHPVAVLAGPNLAKEILAGQPAASVVAIDDETIAHELQRIFTRPSLLIYTNPDVVGCEVSGVVKNIIAIAAGMAEGMGFGENSRATIITRGLAEMSRLGLALGGNALTFARLLAWLALATSLLRVHRSRAATTLLACSSGRGAASTRSLLA